MRAMVLHAFDGPDRFREQEVDRPSPAPTEVLVKVAATGLNPVEWNASAGGWIAALHFVRVPQNMTLVEAAGLPLAGLTAWQALVDVAAVSAGQRVLVTAAAGGVGHLAVQIAKARGAYVIGTARAGNHDFLRTLGVDHPVDYTTTELSTVDPVDVVVDLTGTQKATLREGGVHVSVAGPSDHGVELLVEPDLTGLRALADLVGRGLLRVHVDRVFPLNKAAEAHDHGRTGRTRGKLVLTLQALEQTVQSGQRL